MTLAACQTHQPMHSFLKGWICARCRQPIRFEISPETQAELDAIDANIRNAATKAKDIFLD